MSDVLMVLWETRERFQRILDAKVRGNDVHEPQRIEATIEGQCTLGIEAINAAIARLSAEPPQPELALLKQLVEETVMVATTDEDGEGFISAYHFKTGAIHRLLAAVRTGNYPAHIVQQHPSAEPKVDEPPQPEDARPHLLPNVCPECDSRKVTVSCDDCQCEWETLDKFMENNRGRH